MAEIFGLIKKQHKFIITSVLLFVIGIIIGYVFFLKYPDFIFSNFEKIFGDILKLGHLLEKSSKSRIIGLIFRNNLRALLFMMFGGLALGFVPIFGITFNGFIVGIVLALNFYNNQPLAFFLAAILPHGIFELPAILIGGAFGLKIGCELIFPGNEIRKEKLKNNLYQSVFSLTVLVPILLIAAVIETVITPHILKRFF